MKPTTEEILRKVSELAGCSVTLESKLSDLSISSLDLLKFIFNVEEEYDIEVPENLNARNLFTVGDVVKAIVND